MIEAVKEFSIGNIRVGGRLPFFLIAGVCVIEDAERTRRIAAELKSICVSQGVDLIFKASYDKANRTSLKSYRGPGLEKGLQLLKEIKTELDLSLLVDFHREQDAAAVAEVADVIQVPAFLCRQTDLVMAAARTGRAVNVKKGQFLAPEDLSSIIDKILSAGNDRILLTERGVSFGYHYLVNDIKGLVRMRRLGFPVVFDATHSTQLPSAGEGVSGGERDLAQPLARSALAAGCDGIFLEVHDQPQGALSDGPSLLPLDRLPALLGELKAIDRIVKKGGRE